MNQAQKTASLSGSLPQSKSARAKAKRPLCLSNESLQTASTSGTKVTKALPNPKSAKLQTDNGALHLSKESLQTASTSGKVPLLPKPKSAKLPRANGKLRLSEEDYKRLMPAEMVPLWDTMLEEQKKEVRDIIANKAYLAREFRRFQTTKAIYEKKIASYEQQVEMLKEDVLDAKEKLAIQTDRQKILKKKLEANEEDLQSFKAQVKKDLRREKEVDALKADISAVEKACRETMKKLKKRVSKLKIRSAEEKVVMAAFEKKLNKLKDYRDDLEEKDLLCPEEFDKLNEAVTEFQFNLLLYENDDKQVKEVLGEYEKLVKPNCK